MRGRLLAVGMVGLLLAAGLAGALPSREPSISVYAPENTVQPGTETNFTVQVVNSARFASSDGNATGTAKNVRVTLAEGGAPIEVQTGTVPLGSIPDGGRAPATFRITVDESANPGTYSTTATVIYEYTKPDGTTDSVSRQHGLTVTVSDDARFRVRSTAETVAVGDGGNVSVTLQNTGETDASSAVVNVRSGSPALTFGGSGSASRYVGDWDDGASRTVTFDAAVAQGTDARPLPVFVTVDYENEDGVQRSSRRLTASVTPAGEQRVDVAVTGGLHVGEKGTVTARVTNRGPNTLRDATLALQPVGETVVPVEPEQPLGTLEPDESTTVEYPVRIAGSAEPGPKQLSFVTNYRNADGQQQQTDPASVRVDVGGAQSFALSNVSGDLRVDAEGTLRATVTNEGPSPVSDAVVRLEASDRNVHLGTSEYAVGDLGVDESATFAVPVEVSEGAAAGPRQLSATVRYHNAADERRSSDQLSARVDVAPSRPVFDVAPVNNTVAVGDSGTVTLRVTNAGNETLRDVSAKAFVNDPLTADSDEAYVPSLAPGESTQVSFDVSVASGAATRTRALELDFQYTEPDGDTLLSDTYKVPVELTEGESGDFPFVLVGGAAVALLGAGGVAVTRFR